MRGRFITIEGGEGVGKSTFIAGLTKALQRQGRTVVRTFEPGGTPIADRLRELFVKPPSGELLTIEAEACMVSGARAQHVKHKILPALDSGAWVVCDRFADSARIYQGVIGGVDRQSLEVLIAFTTFGLQPDLTFLLDCDTKISMQRLKKRSNENGTMDQSRFDERKRSFHEKIREGFLQLAKEHRRFAIIDAAKDPEDVLRDAVSMLNDRLGHG